MRKYIILVGDGMADYPLQELGGKTPLEVARTPNMDRIASCRIGRVQTIPVGMEPGSDIANMALLGYEPGKYHTGRSPLEAASMGVSLRPQDVAFRMNLVTLDRSQDNRVIMVSHSSGDITTPEAGQLVESLKQELQQPGIAIHAGVAYRHLLVWEEGTEDAHTIPPHDVLDQDMSDYVHHSLHNPIPDLIKQSWKILEHHPVNQKRKQAGLCEANSIWLWGQGRAPTLPLFKDRFGLEGGVISAVDLIKGMGAYIGLRPIHVEGATGYLHTNYKGKAEEALKALQEIDFIFLHVEAPDEAGHNGNYEEKIQAIELFDEKVVGTVVDGLARFKDYRVMVVSDHFTPIIKKTHTSEAAPFAWAGKSELESISRTVPFTENAATANGLLIPAGHELMDGFLQE
jgi:2,3-bisphosphoglycerate-independent phosphoglycerate mutase